MKQTKMRLGAASAILLTFAMAGVVLTATPAGAYSRGFDIHNATNLHLYVAGVDKVACQGGDYGNNVCSRGWYHFDFEGRPQDGSVLGPTQTQRWEVTRSLCCAGHIVGAARVMYDAAIQNRRAPFLVAVLKNYWSEGVSSCYVADEFKSQYKCSQVGGPERLVVQAK